MTRRKIVFTLALSLLIFLSISFASLSYAATPTLSLSTTGQTGDYVQINVTGDAGSSVMLFGASWMIPLSPNLPQSGTYSYSLGSALSENQNVLIAPNTMVYVKTGGLNGVASNQVAWPYVQNSVTTNTLTLSQSALLLNAGQTSTITASANYLYLLNNTNPTIANLNFNGSQITVQALTYGSTVANICVVGSSTNCASVTITVQNSSAQQLSFSQNNFSIVSGQTVSVAVSGGSGTYTISNNSNPSSIQSSLSGSNVSLTASTTTGASSITVCTTDMNYCGIINVSSTASNSTAITFSQTNPVVSVGQTSTVTIYGGTGNNFYVSSNSNPSIVQANINNNILTLIANTATGTSNISICAYAGSCAQLVANVSATSNSGGAISLSQTTISILAGQSSNITISGGSAPYNISAPSVANVFNGVVNGNILTIYGVNKGSSTVSVCASVGCTTLNVTVNDTATTVNPPTFSQNNILLNINQQMTISIAGNGGYYISNNSNSGIASEQISGSSLTVTAMTAGTANVSVCQSGGQCATLYITVSGPTTSGTQIVLSQNNLSLAPGQNSTITITGTGNYYIASNSTPSVATAQVSGNSLIVSGVGYGTDSISLCQGLGQCTMLSISVIAPVTPTTPVVSVNNAFVRYLGFSDKGDDVLKLQKLLLENKFLSAKPNGNFGPATIAAVKKFQKANGIKQTGNVGPATLNALNKILSADDSSSATPSTLNISQIQLEIQKLLAQVAQLQGR